SLRFALSLSVSSRVVHIRHDSLRGCRDTWPAYRACALLSIRESSSQTADAYLQLLLFGDEFQVPLPIALPRHPNRRSLPCDLTRTRQVRSPRGRLYDRAVASGSRRRPA